MKFDSNMYYLKSPMEMAQLFADLPDALTNSMRIAEQCSVNPLIYKAHLPNYIIPPEYASQKDYLHALCVEAVKERFGEMTETISQQLDYKLNMISHKCFSPNSLIATFFVT